MRECNLAVQNVKVFYGPKRAQIAALDGVSLDFFPGEVTLVMGPSGSGKTTLLSLLGCLRSADEGSVFFEGRDVNRLSERERCRVRRRIGFIFQAFRLFHSLPALENVLMAGEISGGRSESAARGLLERLGLGSKLRLRPEALSGGEKQRVAIARALLSDPPIVLADEPTASLDSQSGQKISDILRTIAIEQNRTVVVVSHDQRWIPFAHRIVHLEDGRVNHGRTIQTCEYMSEQVLTHS